MSVSLRVTGSWAELTADGTVAIPATPQAGDRMFLFARWKDFSVTATVANWTELVEFADGSTSAGNGTGSVKVGCWYRDWQAGDTDPTIDFSASPDNASVVIMVMQKGPDDVWLTPVAVTAAMTTWTTTSQSVSASTTATVPSSSAVMGLIGIRDDTATMTRPTNGIDDSGALVTWNGNYVESPATHHSTTTGFDGAADLGYRLVATGAAGVTLRLTGTISAAETGTALWVVQGVNVQVTPGNASLTSSRFAPQLQLAITPANTSLTTSSFAPQLRLVITPATATLSMTTFSPQLRVVITPTTVTLTLTSFTAQLREVLTPANSTLSLTGFAPALNERLIPDSLSITLTTFAPSVTQLLLLTVPNASLTLTSSPPHILPFGIVFIDPGGDAVQLPGYFNNDPTPGLMTFDSAQKVVGVGSYKFDSDTGSAVIASIPGVLGAARRISTYFRYDSLPDQTTARAEFLSTSPSEAYSGGGFDDAVNVEADDGVYATATPAKNAGQGSTCVPASVLLIPGNAIIDSVKIIYERKYDVDTSIGISRVKWVIDGVEGPNHDNTDMPLTDTVVEVDVTNDRFWEPQDLDPAVFNVVVEARRGDTDTAHTQSWDYAKVEVVYHIGTVVLAGMDSTGHEQHKLFDIALNPKGDRSVFRFTDGGGNSFDGITPLLVNTWNRLSVSYVLNATDDLDVKVYVNGIEELSIEQASTGGFSPFANLLYGWVTSPGVDHLCWFEQLFIDNGDDLTDTVFGPGFRAPLSTAKLPASVNENEWDTTTGTGAVDERPLSETNLKRHNAATTARQTYTLQAANVGDVDISTKTPLGYMGWAWARMQFDDERAFLVVNGSNINVAGPIKATPSLVTHVVTSATYPNNAAGIGMETDEDTGGVDVYLFECGVVVAYEGLTNPDILLPRQEVANETLDTIIDDLRADPPDSYEVCYVMNEFEGLVTIDIYSLDQDGGSLQFQGSLQASGGSGRTRITPGVEVRLDVTVVGVTMLQIYRRVNID